MFSRIRPRDLRQKSFFFLCDGSGLRVKNVKKNVCVFCFFFGPPNTCLHMAVQGFRSFARFSHKAKLHGLLSSVATCLPVHVANRDTGAIP